MNRLEPITKPRSIFTRLIYFLLKRRYGKVIAPASIIYARSSPVLWASAKIQNTDKKLSLSKREILLIRSFTSHLNDCPWCSNFQEYNTIKNKEDFQNTVELMSYQTSSKFTNKEKAMLTYIEEVTLSKNSTDETFTTLKNHFSDREIVEITWVNASENYFNLLAKPLGVTSDDLKA